MRKILDLESNILMAIYGVNRHIKGNSKNKAVDGKFDFKSVMMSGFQEEAAGKTSEDIEKKRD